LEAIDELVARIGARPKVRLHVSPDAVVWLSVPLHHHHIAHAVELVPDATVPVGRVFIEGGIESVV
jgi:hypothetical protein